MAQDLGTLFLETAQAPLGQAGTLFDTHKVDEALELLSPASLRGGIDAAAEAVAKRAGVRLADVTALLPQADMDHVLRQLTECHIDATTQWHAHTGHLGGLLDGVATLTSIGKAPDPGTCLFRLSEKMKLDKLLAAPLSALGAAVDNWQIVVNECQRRLDNGDSLTAAYRKRRQLRVAAIVALAAVVALATVVFWRVASARSAVQAALDHADPCSFESLDEADVGRASASQETALAQKRVACSTRRQAKVDADAKVAREETARLAEEKKRKQDAVWCVDLKSAFENPTSALSADAVKVSGDFRDLFERARQRKLLVDDVVSDLKDLPCRDTQAEAIIDLQLAIGFIANAGSWVGVKLPSAAVAQLLDDQSNKMPPRSRSFFQWRVEKFTGDAVNAGLPDGVKQAKGLCDIVRRLDLVDGPNCRGASIL